MIGAVEKTRKKDPQGYKKKRAAKLLAAVLKVAFEDIPSDPTRDTYGEAGTRRTSIGSGQIPPAVLSVRSLPAIRAREGDRADLG